MSEAEVAKSLSSDVAPHDDLSIYCDFDNETITQDSVKSQVNKMIQIANLIQHSIKRNKHNDQRNHRAFTYKCKISQCYD